MSGINNHDPELFERSLIRNLVNHAKESGLNLSGETSSDYLENFIDQLSGVSNQSVVVLVDEYDKPIIDQLENMKIAIKNREILRRFYAILKVKDGKIKFLFLTGVTKFSKVSLFSGLNNLEDLSLSDSAAALLGLTQEEISDYYAKNIGRIAQEKGDSVEKVFKSLKWWYNGYRFSKSENAKRVYNPLSIMQFLKTG
jgi:hypothetical protein